MTPLRKLIEQAKQGDVDAFIALEDKSIVTADLLDRAMAELKLWAEENRASGYSDWEDGTSQLLAEFALLSTSQPGDKEAS